MMPTLLTLFEYQSLPYQQIPGIPRDPAAREHLLNQLEQLNHTAGQEILSLGRQELRANAWVGVASVGDLTIEILPKIDWDGPEAEQSNAKTVEKSSEAASHRQSYSAVQNLLRMLSYAFDLNIHEQAAGSLDQQTGSWFELLTRLFAENLYQQVLSGLPHQYITLEETLPVLRGRWNLQRQILRQGHTRHAFDVTHDEYSADIPLNQVFRRCIEDLLPLTRDAHSQAMLGDLAEWFSPVTRLPEIKEDLLASIQFTRLNERFQTAFKLARLFLSGQNIDLRAGKLPIHALIFDMNLLFERFTAAFIQRYRKAILPEAWQKATLRVQSAGKKLYLARSEGHRLFRLVPDLLLTRGNEAVPLLIADTKYKRLDPAQRRLGITQEDIYQMLAYSTHLHCPRELLIFPQSAGTEPLRKRFEIESAPLSLLAATINLRVPLDPPEPLIQELADIFQLISA